MATGDKRATLRATLAKLNERTRYRFTGVYRLVPPMLENVCLFDRENPTLNVSGDIHLLKDTYCAIVQATGESFQTADSGNDERIAQHPARDRIISYCGIPLHVEGAVRGVLCHYDSRPRLTPKGELEFLATIEPILVAHLEG